MLTAFQCEVVAFWTDGGLVCRDCAVRDFEDQGGERVSEYRPVIRYGLDEYQSESSYDWDGECPLGNETPIRAGEDSCSCAHAVVCDDCGDEILEAYEDDWSHVAEEEAS